jgi:DNA-repair protein complementing XP-A cells
VIDCSFAPDMSDQARLTQLSRLKAKQAIRASALAARRRSASPPNASAGPPVPKTSRDAAAANKELAPLERDSRLGNYFEYDLSKMVNSRGGFLLDDDEGLGERAAIEKKRKEEREKAFNGKSGAWEPGTSTLLAFVRRPTADRSVWGDVRRPRCPQRASLQGVSNGRDRPTLARHLPHRHLRTLQEEVSGQVLAVDQDGVPVGLPSDGRYVSVAPSSHAAPSLTSLVTPSFTLDELKDETILPHLLRPNPHGGTFSNMMLFLRLQAEEFAFKKWGGEEALDDEFDRREYVRGSQHASPRVPVRADSLALRNRKEKSQKKAKKFQKGLQECVAATHISPPLS